MPVGGDISWDISDIQSEIIYRYRIRNPDDSRFVCEFKKEKKTKKTMFFQLIGKKIKSMNNYLNIKVISNK